MRALVPLCAALLALAGPGHAQTSAIQASRAWARASPVEGGTVSVYVTLHDSGAADRLTSVTSDAAGMAMLHESTMANGVSQMRPVQAVALPAGGTVALKPGGLHVMLMDMNRQLRTGDRFTVVLTFDRAPPLTVPVQVMPPGSPGPAP